MSAPYALLWSTLYFLFPVQQSIFVCCDVFAVYGGNHTIDGISVTLTSGGICNLC